jgi:hypothetical protein
MKDDQIPSQQIYLFYKTIFQSSMEMIFCNYDYELDKKIVLYIQLLLKFI